MSNYKQDKYDPILGMSMREFKAKEKMEDISKTKERESSMRSKIKNMTPKKKVVKAKAKTKPTGLGRDLIAEGLKNQEYNHPRNYNTAGKIWDRLKK